MSFHPTVLRLRDYAATSMMRHQGFVAIVMKLTIIFLMGYALNKAFVLLSDFFDANPETLNSLITILLRVGIWGIGISLCFYFLSWLGHHLGVPAAYRRKLDIAGNVILGALASGVILALIMVLIMVAYIFLVICLTVVKNVAITLWGWAAAASAG